MKHLFIALFCTVIGLNASALTNPEKMSKPKTITLNMKSITKNQKALKKYASWFYQDGCGNSLTIVVEAPDGTPRWQMLRAANEHFRSKLDDNLCL